MSGELAPTGPELGRRNRRLLAERLSGPEGALKACEETELARSRRRVNYMSENTTLGFNRPAGFYSVTGWNWRGERTVYGATVEALVATIELAEAERTQLGKETGS